MDQPTAEEALRKLEPLVGEWTVEARWPSGEPWPGGGRATFEWHASRAHLIERATLCSTPYPRAPAEVFHPRRVTTEAGTSRRSAARRRDRRQGADDRKSPRHRGPRYRRGDRGTRRRQPRARRPGRRTMRPGR